MSALPGGTHGPTPSRRDVLRWAGAAGVLASVPLALTACEPPDPPKILAPDPSLRPLGFVGGTDAEVGPGGWCWFQSPRASIGPDQRLWLGSSVSNTGTTDDGAVQITAYDLAQQVVTERRTVATTREDDHTSPSVLALDDGVQVAWALHQKFDYVDIATTAASAPMDVHRVHRPGAIKSPAHGTAYASAHLVGGQRWILYRGEQYSWNLLTSDDGATWTARGLVVAPASPGDRPYLRAVSDGDALHVWVTDANPTEFRGNGVYGATIGSDLRIRRYTGTIIGSVGSGAPKPRAFNRVVPGVVGADATVDTDAWHCDLQFVDGRPTGVLSVRDAWPDGSDRIGGYRHRYLWARQQSAGWLVEPLCWAGSELCLNQPDYTGLAAQDPTDPNRVVVSTNVDPVTGEPLVSGADGLVHFELFEGYRVGEGTWSWTPLTVDSTEDNIRPVIAAGGPSKVLAFMRGRYFGWTSFTTRIVLRPAVAAPASS